MMRSVGLGTHISQITDGLMEDLRGRTEIGWPRLGIPGEADFSHE